MLRVGGYLVRAFLSPQFHPSEIGDVVGFTRDPTSEKSKLLTAAGVDVRATTTDMDVYKGLDVLVNVANAMVPSDWEALDQQVKAAIDAGIKVYIPNEFGL